MRAQWSDQLIPRSTDSVPAASTSVMLAFHNGAVTIASRSLHHLQSSQAGGSSHG